MEMQDLDSATEEMLLRELSSPPVALLLQIDLLNGRLLLARLPAQCDDACRKHMQRRRRILL